MNTIRGLKLKLQEYIPDQEKAREVDQYFKLFDDYLTQRGRTSWIHRAEYF